MNTQATPHTSLSATPTALSEPATETTQAGPGRVEAAPALPSPVVVFTEAQADENLSKLRKWADLMQEAKACEERSLGDALNCRDHLLTGFATDAIKYGQRSQDEEERAARLRDEAEAVQW